MGKKYDVLLLGYYGFGNLGDELLAEAAVSLLREAGVAQSRIAILSSAPADSEERFGVVSFNPRPHGEVTKASSDSPTLLLGGGGHFHDSTNLR